MSIWDTYPKPAKEGSRVVETYDYVNERKELYLRVRRHDPKGFSQQFYFEKAWHDGKAEGRAFPYKLQHLIDAPPTQPVWICEGEKDVDTLTALGLVATTNAGGAGKWRSDLNPWFMGRDTVYVLEDNDERGREHALLVARHLQPLVGKVQIVAFDEVPEGEDVTYWLENGGTKEALLARAADAPAYKDAISASAFSLPDVATIPRREWAYWPHYVRGFVSLTLAPGGVGKSALIVAETLAMVTGKPLLGVTPPKPLRVWYLNLEDPMDELHRRVTAAAKLHGVTRADLGDRLFINSGRKTPFVLALERNRSALIDQAVFSGAVNTIRNQEIDIVIVDPVVASHRLQENDNAQIDTLARAYAQIAEETDTAVMLVHHTRKMGPERGTVDDGRGASALLAAARSARLLSRMSSKEAADANIEERLRWSYFRSDLGKANMAPPAEGATWYRMNSVDLGNESRDLDRGDSVGVITAFHYPTTERLPVSPADIRRVLTMVGIGGPWRENPRADAWVGYAVGQVLRLGPLDVKTKRQVLALVKDWLGAGILRRVERRDAKSNTRIFIEAGETPSVEGAEAEHGDE